MEVGLEDYACPFKHAARQRAWRRVRDRLSVKTRYARGVALLGPDPSYDLAVAERIGFDLKNIVGLDRSPAAVKRSRQAGCLAIEADLELAIAAWNDEPLDFLFIDSCSTYGLAARLVATSEYTPAMNTKTVVYLNMQRGRHSERYRKILDACCEFNPPMRERLDGEKHAGKIAHEIAMAYTIALCVERQREGKGSYFPRLPGGGYWIRKTVLEGLRRHTGAAFDSYKNRNGRNYMDSVVMRWPLNQLRMVAWGSETRMVRQVATTRQRLAALKAIKTRKERSPQ